ncbi:MAG: hypothetical protein L3J87_01915 [Thermoplasmata archaeon]|nr:hypothetical protein [Thermoplasmata archaeon]MCI4344367.1 hypothetical protein [Thermoplasmata archaeon]
MQFSMLTEPVVIAAALFASAFVFLLWVVGSRSKSTVGTVVLDIVSMLVGVAGLSVAVYDAVYAQTPAVYLGILGFAGVVLVGKSLRDLPWIGLLSLASAVAAGFALNALLPLGTPLWVVVGGAAVVFLLAYFLLGAVGGLFKLVALLAIPRIVSILMALAAAAAGILELFPNVAAGAP